MGGKVRIGAVSVLCFSWFLVASSANYTNILRQDALLRIGEQLVSSNQLFSLGFVFPYGIADLGAFLCINWYNRNEDVSTDTWPPLWVGNPDSPIPEGPIVRISNSSVGLLLGRYGQLMVKIGVQGSYAIPVYGGEGNSINASAILQDNGNFVIHKLNSDGSVKRILWQSFDHPYDTLLPGMRLGINNNLTSREDEYFSTKPGSFTFGMNPNGAKELIIWRQDSVVWRSGIWQQNSLQVQYHAQNFGIFYYNFSFIQIGNKTFFTYTVNSSGTSFISLNLGTRGSLVQVSRLRSIGSLVSCLQYYEADFLSAANGGCTNQPERPNCYNALREEDIFPHIGLMSEPGINKNITGKSRTIDYCRTKCLSNCSCLAYAETNNNDNTGCEIWMTRAKFLEDSSSNGRRIYILPLKEVKWWPGLIVAVGGIIILPSLLSFCYILWKKCRSKGSQDINRMALIKELEGNEGLTGSFGKPKRGRKDRNELHMFSFQNILFATDYFSDAKKLGAGGYGPVYKGILNDGREVAIKRLAGSSRQGVAEFKNEAVLIAKLQHTNLVRLLGFCIQGEEKILIYEYLPNKSLDSFIFDSEKKKNLSWKLRFHIIEGIAQGVLYLHKYSRLRVIHRDLKASNILLDKDMNPKISDFGMARICELNKPEDNTNRVVGTQGYMSPEYFYHGLVSVKTDVFSFGILLLELVSGRKNTANYDPESPLLLTGYAWQLWNEGKGSEIIDTSMDEHRSPGQILRCIHIGLLCVQDHAVDRPTMSDVVSMLENENKPLPEPNQPGFFINSGAQEAGDSKIKPQNCSINLVSITVMEAR